MGLCVAARCSVLQCVAMCCIVLQCVAVCCSVLQCVAVCCSAWHFFLQMVGDLICFVLLDCNYCFSVFSVQQEKRVNSANRENSHCLP